MVEISNYKASIDNIYQCKLPWNKLSGCNILITGASGLIGSCLVETLMNKPNRNYHVYAACRNEERAKIRFSGYLTDESFHIIVYDVCNPLKCNIDFDYIVHAASNASPNFFAKNPVEIMKSNIYGVANLMDYGLSHNMRRFLYISTGEIYGEGNGNAFKEEDSGYVNCMTARACYPSSKRAAETLCVSYVTEYGADICIARPCHTYGPYFTESDNRVYAQFIRNVLDSKDIIMKSTGTQYRSWCYVVNCVKALVYILLKGSNGQSYNIADKDSNITIKELAEMIADIGGKKVIMDFPNNDEMKGFNVVKQSTFDTSKLEALGWSALNNIRENMIDTINERKNKYRKIIK
jgi:nucleoside-diphosphate-sugar epimerase